MKHSIRVNGEIKIVDCELGSGLVDKHGREIFEGDKVKILGKPFVDSTIRFHGGHFDLGDDMKLLSTLHSSYIEIIDTEKTQ